jgi:type IV fimbrial biogenesis protein FimT
MMVTLSIAGAVTAGATGLGTVLDDHRKTAAVNDLVGTLNLARSEAIKRGRRVVLCPSRDMRQCESADGDRTVWHDGILTYIDENDNGQYDTADSVIRYEVPSSRLKVQSSPNRTRVTYQPTGLAGGSTITITVCGASPKGKARYIIVANTGRVRTSELPGDGKADAAHETCQA